MRSVRQLLKYRYGEPPPTLKILYEGTQIAELKKEGTQYTFRYLDDFYRLALQPLPGLKPGEDYVSTELPLYFRERMPDVRRPEVRELMRQFEIPEDQDLLLLATLGKHTVTDPFEFHLTAA